MHHSSYSTALFRYFAEGLYGIKYGTVPLSGPWRAPQHLRVPRSTFTSRTHASQTPSSFSPSIINPSSSINGSYLLPVTSNTAPDFTTSPSTGSGPKRLKKPRWRNRATDNLSQVIDSSCSEKSRERISREGDSNEPLDSEVLVIRRSRTLGQRLSTKSYSVEPSQSSEKLLTRKEKSPREVLDAKPQNLRTGAGVTEQTKRSYTGSKEDGAMTPREREDWQIQKEALKQKFGSDGWNPRKRLSPDALEGIRSLHAQYPDTYTTPVLAEHFKVSPEAIRRILRSKWKPSEEEEEDRRRRWDKRGESIWSSMVELGIKPPKKWREMGVGRRVHDGENRPKRRSETSFDPVNQNPISQPDRISRRVLRSLSHRIV